MTAVGRDGGDATFAIFLWEKKARHKKVLSPFSPSLSWYWKGEEKQLLGLLKVKMVGMGGGELEEKREQAVKERRFIELRIASSLGN